MLSWSYFVSYWVSSVVNKEAAWLDLKVATHFFLCFPKVRHKTKCFNYQKSVTFSKAWYSCLIYWHCEYIQMETPALFLFMIYLEHTKPEFSYVFSKLFLKMPLHFLVLMKIIKTRLLKIISKKISKSSFCRMSLANIFLMSLLKMPFRRLWGSLFLLMLSHCQFLRRTLEFKFDAAVKKNIWNITLEIWGTKFLSVCHKREGFECHLFH